MDPLEQEQTRGLNVFAWQNVYCSLTPAWAGLTTSSLVNLLCINFDSIVSFYDKMLFSAGVGCWLNGHQTIFLPLQESRPAKCIVKSGICKMEN